MSEIEKSKVIEKAKLLMIAMINCISYEQAVKLIEILEDCGV